MRKPGRLICYRGPEETPGFEDALRSAIPGAGILPVNSLPELISAAQEDIPGFFVLGIGRSLPEREEVLRHPDLRRRSHLVVALAENEESARSLALLGAGEVLPAAWIWRLPATISKLEERARILRKRNSLEELLKAVKGLSSARDLQQIIDIVRRAARRILGADGASFVLRNGDQCHYMDEDAIGPLWKGRKFPMSACISGWTMLNGRAAAVGDIYQDPRIPVEAYRPTFVRSLAMVPIRAESPIGAIGTYWANTREFDDEEVSLLQALADATAPAIENTNALADLEHLVQARTAGLEAANRELEALSHSTSYELRSPLNAILALCGALDAGPSDPGKDRKLVAGIRDSAEQIRCIAEDLRRFAEVDGLPAVSPQRSTGIPSP